MSACSRLVCTPLPVRTGSTVTHVSVYRAILGLIVRPMLMTAKTFLASTMERKFSTKDVVVTVDYLLPVVSVGICGR